MSTMSSTSSVRHSLRSKATQSFKKRAAVCRLRAKKGDPGQPVVWEMPAKSWINFPAPEQGSVPAGLVQIKGVGFSGLTAVKAIEVSVDGGKSFKPAQLVGPDLSKYAWRQFVFPVVLAAGTHRLMCHVIETSGTVQAEERVENADGYSNASWRDHALDITVV